MQYVRARIIWSNEPALAVPIVAVSRLAGQHFVFVAEQSDKGVRGAPEAGHARRGARAKTTSSVSGLEPGERVIVSNVQKLGDGAPVKPS